MSEQPCRARCRHRTAEARHLGLLLTLHPLRLQLLLRLLSLLRRLRNLLRLLRLLLQGVAPAGSLLERVAPAGGRHRRARARQAALQELLLLEIHRGRGDLRAWPSSL